MIREGEILSYTNKNRRNLLLVDLPCKKQKRSSLEGKKIIQVRNADLYKERDQRSKWRDSCARRMDKMVLASFEWWPEWKQNLGKSWLENIIIKATEKSWGSLAERVLTACHFYSFTWLLWQTNVVCHLNQLLDVYIDSFLLHWWLILTQL